MKKKILISIGVVGLLYCLLGGLLFYNSLEAFDEVHIKSTFNEIRIGEASKNGEFLWKFADKNTNSYFEEINRDILNLDSIRLSKKGLFYQILILSFRGAILNENIKNSNGKNLFIHYFNNISNIPEIIRDRKLVNIKIDGNAATAEMNSKALPYQEKFIVKFNREDKKWKYDFSSYFMNNEYVVKKMVELSKNTDEKYLTEVIKQKGISIDIQTLFKPINKK